MMMMMMSSQAQLESEAWAVARWRRLGDEGIEIE